MGYRTDIRIQENQYTLTSGVGTFITVSLTGTTAAPLFVTEIAVGHHTVQTSNQATLMFIDATEILRFRTKTGNTSRRLQFYNPIYVPAGSSCSVRVSNSGAATTVDVSLRYYREKV